MKFEAEQDWPLIIADILINSDNSWLTDIPNYILKRCKRESNNFMFKNDIFVRIMDDKILTAPYVKSTNRTGVIERFHQQLVHLKYDSIIDLLARRYWWPGVKKEVKDYIAGCPQYQLSRSASEVHAPTPLQPVPPVALHFERWRIDFVGLPQETKTGNKFIIAAIDYATRWVVARPTKSMDETTVAFFIYHLMMNYGIPYELISDSKILPGRRN